jgi:hypothetical protein
MVERSSWVVEGAVSMLIAVILADRPTPCRHEHRPTRITTSIAERSHLVDICH